MPFLPYNNVRRQNIRKIYKYVGRNGHLRSEELDRDGIGEIEHKGEEKTLIHKTKYKTVFLTIQ